MRHLSREFQESAIRRGKCIEQFLGGEQLSEDFVVRFVIIAPERNGVRMSMYESLDMGSPDYSDIYSFPSHDPSLEGDPAWECHYDSLDSALRAASSELSASPDRWVNQGVCASEYLDYRARAK